ncbi:MAG: AmiS/UreI family transporter [Lachnospiraceae bacterium]|nr:AmiS/UreI family transporter [Lachnospiraceae bacterium]
MLGVCLLFIGIVLMNNGFGTLWKVPGKAVAVMNFLVGGLSVFINFVSLVQGNYYAAGTGLLFGFTYLFVRFNHIFSLDTKPFAVFSTFVAVNAVVFGIVEGVTGSTALGIMPDWRWAVIWWLWAVLWGSAFVTDILKKDLGNFVPGLQIFEGIVTAWIPGVMLLLKIW